jgi:predicted  nucleic acid-binding Zn-ribbon protein
VSELPAKKQDQARLLVALQDLDHMITEAEDTKTAAKLQEMGFPMDGLEELKKARAELTQHIKPQLLNRYQRVSKSYDRTVVPVVGELCTGCFAKVPTSFRYEKNAVVACESCGRILYFT